MRPKLFPTGLATKENKKKWLVYELLRFRDYIKIAQTIKVILSILGGQLIFAAIGGGWGVAAALAAIFVFDFFYEFYLFLRLKDFYLDMGEACFDVESTHSEHDFRILMNRVENFIKTKDSDKKEEFYKTLEACYTDMQVKMTIKEGLEDMVKDLKKI